MLSVQWRHNGRDGVTNHQPHDCSLNRLCRRRSKKTSMLRVTGLCAGNSPVTGEFPAKRASNAENVSIWWRHHDYTTMMPLSHDVEKYLSCLSNHEICLAAWFKVRKLYLKSFSYSKSFCQAYFMVTKAWQIFFQHCVRVAWFISNAMLCTAQLGGPVLKAFGRVQYTPFQLADKSPMITDQHTAGGSVSQLSQLAKLSPWLTLSTKDITASFWHYNKWFCFLSNQIMDLYHFSYPIK